MRKFVGSVILCLVFVFGVAFQNESLGQSALTPGNILISELNTGELTEVTTSGSVVQTFNIPNVNGGFIGLRDIVVGSCLLYTSPSPRDRTRSRMPSSA